MTILLLFLLCMPQEDSPGPGSQRDLVSYDQAGPYEIRPGANRDATAVREFIWTHWRDRRKGRLTVTEYGKEGQVSHLSYFVEPYQAQQWRVLIDIEMDFQSKRAAGKTFHEEHRLEATAIQRIEPPADGLSPRTVIPPTADRSPESFRLALNGADGRPVRII